MSNTPPPPQEAYKRLDKARAVAEGIAAEVAAANMLMVVAERLLDDSTMPSVLLDKKLISAVCAQRIAALLQAEATRRLDSVPDTIKL